MNVHKFVAEYGIDKVKQVLRSAYTHCVYVETPTHFNIEESVLVHENDFKEICESCVDLKGLKQVVESIYMVGDFGTLDKAKKYTVSDYTAPEVKYRLEKAIADYELVESFKSEVRNG